MNNNKVLIIILICALAALALCVWIGLRYYSSRSSAAAGPGKGADTSAAELALMLIKDSDLRTDASSAKEIDVSGMSEGLLIDAGGDYILSGSMYGTIVIDADKERVHLFLDGVSVTSYEGPALLVRNADKVILTLQEGTFNTFSDSSDYRSAKDAEACIFSSCDLTVNGYGGLNVNGYYKDAIRSKDVIRILSGAITVKSKRTGIHATDGIRIDGGSIEISSEKYGIKTTKMTDSEGRGTLLISGGTHSIVTGRYSFVCERGDLYIYGCSILNKSAVAVYDVYGQANIQDGCIR